MFLKASKKARWLILFVSAMIICLACVIFVTINFDRSEKMLELTHNAGYVRAGQVVKHDFPIVNKSRKSLQILDIKASCSCNLPKEVVRKIKPKSTYRLPMNIDTEGRSGLNSATALVKLSNEREIHCTLTCNVVTGYPKELVFPDIMKGEWEKKEFYLQNIAEHKINVKNIKYSHEYFDVKWNEHAMEDEQIFAHKISVTLKDTLPYGPFEQMLTIETDDSLDPNKRVTLRGYVRQPIECDKTRIAMGIIKSGSSKTGKVKIYSPYNEPFKIVKVENVKGDYCNWHLEKIDDTNYELEIKINRTEDETKTIISEEISIYGITAEKVQIRQDIQIFAMLER